MSADSPERFSGAGAWGLPAPAHFMRPALPDYHQLMNGTSEISRPRRYHKADGPWLLVMARLWRAGWGHARIAATLSDLSARACRDWLAGGADPDDLDAHSEPGASALPWTVQQVRYWTQFRGRRPGRRRWRIRQPGPVRHPKRPSRPRHPDERPLDARRAYARDRGWLHLLPAADGEAGLELTRRDVDILSALRDGGPMTRAQLADLLQLRGSARLLCNRRGRSALAKLRRAALVEIVSHWRDRRLYALCEQKGIVE